MTISLYIATFLLVAVGIAHSYLGERYILIRLFRRADLPKLFGSTDFTIRTLRFAWHLTTLAWWGFAALVFHLARRSLSFQKVALIIGITFISTGLVTLVSSRARHLAWPVFLAIGCIALFAAAT